MAPTRTPNKFPCRKADWGGFLREAALFLSPACRLVEDRLSLRGRNVTVLHDLAGGVPIPRMLNAARQVTPSLVDIDALDCLLLCLLGKSKEA